MLMNVLLLNTQMEAAGAQKAMLSLARGLLDQDHEVTVATMYDKGDYVRVFNEQYGLDIVDLRMKATGVRNPLRKAEALARGLFQLYRLMRKGRFDVLQTFSHYSNIIGPIVGWLAGVPARVSSQRMSLRGAPRWLLWLDRLIANSWLVHKMTAVSDETRRFSIEVEGISADKMVTIHNGIDPERYEPCSTNESLRAQLDLCNRFVVTTVARLHRQKGHTYLIEAMPAVINEIPNVCFLLVGEGELEPELRALIDERDLTTWVQLLGVRQDVADILSISDLFVLPSLWEGLPNTILEAMAARVPVIATEIDGCLELVESGRSGLLVPPKDSNALAKSIVNLAKDEERRKELAEYAHARVAVQYSQEANTLAYVTLYQTLRST